jgi:hypothetical protein
MRSLFFSLVLPLPDFTERCIILLSPGTFLLAQKFTGFNNFNRIKGVRIPRRWHISCKIQDRCYAVNLTEDGGTQGSEGGIRTAKIVFKFLQANIADEDTDSFIMNVEEVLKKFAGNAYHFRFDIEPSFPAITPKNHKLKSNGARGQPKS